MCLITVDNIADKNKKMKKRIFLKSNKVSKLCKWTWCFKIKTTEAIRLVCDRRRAEGGIEVGDKEEYEKEDNNGTD